MKYILGLLLILFASYADIFLYRIGIVPLPPASFLIPLFMVVFIIKYPIKDIFVHFKSHTFRFFLAVLILSTVYSSFTKTPGAVLTTIIVLDIITIILYIFALHFFTVEDKKTVFIVILLAFVVLSGSVWYDFIFGLPKYNLTLEQMVRKGGFGENPNKAASGIKFLALAGLVFLEKAKANKYLFIGLMVFSVFITFSRSGIISAVLILMLGTMNNWSSSFQISIPKLIKSVFRLMILFTILYMTLLALADVIRENFPAFTRGAAGERLDLLLGQSEKGVTSEDSGSGGGRGDLFIKYLNNFMDNPFGYGTGYSDDKNFNRLNTHNQYLYMAVNYGIIGLGIFLFLIFYGINISFRKDQFYCLIFYTLFIFEGFVAHNVFSERAILVCLAFFDSLIYKNDSAK